MACYECGSERGSSYQLCPECISSKQSRRASYRKEFLAGPPVEETDTVSKLMNSRLAWILGGFLLANMCFIYFLFEGPFIDSGPVASLLFALAITCSLISTLIWAFFVTRLFAFEPIVGFVSLVLPFMAYRIVLSRWEDNTFKILLMAHLIGIALSYSMCIALANHLGIHVMGVIIIFEAFLKGETIPLQLFMQ